MKEMPYAVEMVETELKKVGEEGVPAGELQQRLGIEDADVKSAVQWLLEEGSVTKEGIVLRRKEDLPDRRAAPPDDPPMIVDGSGKDAEPVRAEGGRPVPDQVLYGASVRLRLQFRAETDEAAVKRLEGITRALAGTTVESSVQGENGYVITEAASNDLEAYDAARAVK